MFSIFSVLSTQESRAHYPREPSGPIEEVKSNKKSNQVEKLHKRASLVRRDWIAASRQEVDNQAQPCYVNEDVRTR